ncbi:MAG: hypothetical protein AAF487_14575, partial [Bacteroidota bacterium]
FNEQVEAFYSKDADFNPEQKQDLFDEAFERIQKEEELNAEALAKGEIGQEKFNATQTQLEEFKKRVEEERVNLGSETDENEIDKPAENSSISDISEEDLEILGLTDETNTLDARIQELRLSEKSEEEKKEAIIQAREDFVSVLSEKTNQNKINIKYAPNEDVEADLIKENDLIFQLIEEQKDLIYSADDLDLATAIDNSNEENTSDSAFSESSINDTVSEDDFSKELEELLSNAEQDPYVNRILDEGIQAIEYDDQNASSLFGQQNELFSERERLIAKNDTEGVLEKEIEIMEVAKKANREEFDFYAQNLEASFPEEVELAKEDMVKASILRSGALMENDISKKSNYLKQAYAYESKSVKIFKSLNTANLESGGQALSVEESTIASQARDMGISPIDSVEEEITKDLDVSEFEQIDDVLREKLRYSDTQIELAKKNPEKLESVVKDWKLSIIDRELQLQSLKVEDYERNYEAKILEHNEIEKKMALTSDQNELQEMNEQADLAIRTAEVYEFYQKMALLNTEILLAKKNDVENGELELASLNASDEDYVKLQEFIENYYEEEALFTENTSSADEKSSDMDAASSNSNESMNKESQITEVIEEEQADSSSDVANEDLAENDSEQNEEDVIKTEVRESEAAVSDEEQEILTKEAMDIESNPLVQSGKEEQRDMAQADSASKSENGDVSITTEVSESLVNQTSPMPEVSEGQIDIDYSDSEEELNREERDGSNSLKTSVSGGNPNKQVEFQAAMDRDNQLIIIEEDGTERNYAYQDGDVVGMNNTINSRPFNVNNEIPSELINELFFLGEENTAAYSNADGGIPLDIEMPSGLVFQVQVGAFYKPVDPSVFAGFAPLNGQRSSSGLIRYRAGMFKIFDTANDAKNAIRAKGYDDAFVVAFLDGERIPLFEARKLLDPLTVEKYNYLARTSKAEDSGSSEKLENGTADPIDNANPIENIAGLFYTVQVGVYSKFVAKQALYNLDPLNSQRTNDEKIRYTSGIFNSFGDASVWKEDVRKKGISDAFVTAYKDGKRISLVEANSLGEKIDPSQKLDLNEFFDTDSKDEGEIWRALDEKMKASNTELKFKVKLGPYTDQVPMNEAHVILDHKDEISFNEAESNVFYYISNREMDLSEAENMKAQFINKSVKNLRIVAIENGREIQIDEAKRKLEN